MRLYTFEADGRQRIGAEQQGTLVDLQAAHAASPEGAVTIFPPDMLALIQSGRAGLKLAEEALHFGLNATGSDQKLVFRLDEVMVRAPLPRPGKILCSGVNYLSHLEENPAAVLPEHPFFFAKLPNTVIGPGEPIILPKLTHQMDYEVEFAVVIGKRMRKLAEDEVMSSIFGYTILHDVSARDVQFKDNQITLGKNFDTFCPLGPCIVTADDIPDPGNLRLSSFLNCMCMQDGSTKDWVFPLPKLLSFLSGVMTLEPGDVVSTGTPAGVGVFRKPSVFLREGDVVTLKIEKIGILENPVIAEE